MLLPEVCLCHFHRDVAVAVDMGYMRNLIVFLPVILPWCALPGPHAGPDALQDRAVAAQFGKVLLSCDSFPASSTFVFDGASKADYHPHAISLFVARNCRYSVLILGSCWTPSLSLLGLLDTTVATRFSFSGHPGLQACPYWDYWI